jgi:hypothetical protein
MSTTSSNENNQDSQKLAGTENKRELAAEKIEHEAETSNHSDANKLTGAATENIDDNTTAGTPKSINNDR